jgi:cyclophilin family peptidyl-prolyl cis-trans isomerase
LRAVRRLLPILACCALLAGCGSSSSGSKPVAPAGNQTATASPTPTTATAPGCTAVATPAPGAQPHLKAPTLKLDPSKTYTVTVVTNCGTFAFALDVKDSPKTSASFYYLVKRGFFNGTIFHRVSAGFVIQGGDPTGTGNGGSGYTIVEPPPASTQYVAGDVAMAKTGAQPAGASGSQFFVVTGANVSQSAGLTPDYALAGKVVSGLSTVERIGALPTSPPQDGMPTSPVVMSSVTVKTS